MSENGTNNILLAKLVLICPPIFRIFRGPFVRLDGQVIESQTYIHTRRTMTESGSLYSLRGMELANRGLDVEKQDNQATRPTARTHGELSVWNF